MQILLTRSKEQNVRLQQQIARPDIPTFNVPLLQALPRPESAQLRGRILQLDHYDQIIFISRNAVVFGLPMLEAYWPQWPLNLRWLAVGSGTAAVLKSLNVDANYPDLASSEGLLALPQLTEVNHQKILIVRGVGGRETLRTELLKRGAEVDYLEVYERETINYAATELPDGAPVVALIYSAEAIAHLYRLITSAAAHYQLIVPSKRLRDMAIGTGFVKVHVARNQEDESMIEVLTGILGQIA